MAFAEMKNLSDEIFSRARTLPTMWCDEIFVTTPFELGGLPLKCPSMNEPEEVYSRFAPEPLPTSHNLDYLGCSGFWPVGMGSRRVAGLWDNGRFEGQTMGAISDGTSNTLFWGESMGATEDGRRVKTWGYTNSHMGLAINDAFFENSPELGFVEAYINPVLIDGIKQYSHLQFSSPHPGTVNFSLGDGSTHAFSREIDLGILEALSTCCNGEVIGDY